MLTTELLARALHAERERTVRERHRDTARIASGPRHPHPFDVEFEVRVPPLVRDPRRPAAA